MYIPKTRMILDCTEIKVQTPSWKVLNSEIYYNHKSHATFKSLIGIASFGSVSFVSSLYTGFISDKGITISFPNPGLYLAYPSLTYKTMSTIYTFLSQKLKT
jgi:hypothetical protein